MLFFEHKHLYRRIKGEVPEDRYTTPFGKARTHRAGDDITVITWGAMVYTADEAATKLAEEDVSVEVLDLSHPDPLGSGVGAEERRPLLEGVRPPRGHEDRGFGAEIAATIAEEAFEQLDAFRAPRRGPRFPRPVRALAREGVHPAGRRCRGALRENSRRPGLRRLTR